MRAEPPRELELVWDFRAFGALPEPGALGDQPAGLLRRMRHAEQIYKLYDSFNSAPSWASWQYDNPDAWAMKTKIDALRVAKAKETTPHA